MHLIIKKTHTFAIIKKKDINNKALKPVEKPQGKYNKSEY